MDISLKKQEILNAARECFSRFGYEKTTLDDIGKIVGMNKASLYYYYKNKEDIYSGVIIYEYKEAMRLLRAKVDNLNGCHEKILTYIREKLHYTQQCINVHNLSLDMFRNVQPALSHPELFKQIRDKESEFIRKILLDCIERGEISPCDTKRIVQTILTVMDAMKAKAFQGIDSRLVEKVDLNAWEEDIVFALSLILDGLSIQHREKS